MAALPIADTELPTLSPASLGLVTGGVAPIVGYGLLAAGAAAYAYVSGGVNVAHTSGNNNNVAVGNRVGGNLTVGNGNASGAGK